MSENTALSRSSLLLTASAVVIALAAVFLVGLQVNGDEDDAATPVAAATTQQTGIVTSGTGSVDGTPDQLEFTATVSNSRASTEAALAATNTDVRAVTAAAKKQGVAAKDIRTATLSLQPAYRYLDGRTQIVGYRATIRLRILVRDLKKAGKVIGAASTTGGNAASIGSIELKISDQDALIAQARAKAVSDAKAAAEAFADAAGREVGKLIFVSEGSDEQPYEGDRDYAYDGLDSLSAATAGRAPISPGQQSLSVTVQVRWAVK